MRRAKKSKEEKAAKDICQVNRWRGKAIETERIKRRSRRRFKVESVVKLGSMRGCCLTLTIRASLLMQA